MLQADLSISQRTGTRLPSVALDFLNFLYSILVTKSRKDQRRRIISKSYDHALAETCRIPLNDVEAKVAELAMAAVKLNSTQCGPTSRKAESFLNQLGYRGFVFTYIGGHYMLHDLFTGLYHDIETYSGCNCRNELAVAEREREIELDPDKTAQIETKYSQRWIEQRMRAIGLIELSAREN